MTGKRMLVFGGLAALAVLLYVGKQTYPSWGMILHQSEGQ